MDEVNAEHASINTSMFEVSMKIESPRPTSMKWTVTFASVWDDAAGMKQTANEPQVKQQEKQPVSLLLYPMLVVSSLVCL